MKPTGQRQRVFFSTPRISGWLLAFALVVVGGCRNDGARGTAERTAAEPAADMASATMSRPTSRPTAAHAASVAIEVDEIRLRAHFDEVLAELKAADVSHLTEPQRAARVQHITELARYRDRGQFPHNHGHPDAFTPYFVDEHGTHCALAHLIDTSGEGALVARIASTRNNAYVSELADERALLAWLDTAGLSPAEAARIQPAYSCEFFPEPCTGNDDVSGLYAIASVAFGVSNLAVIALNIEPSRRARAWFGVMSGGLGMMLGLPRLDNGGNVGRIGAVNLGLGGLATLFSVYSLIVGPSSAPAPLRATLGGVTLEPAVSVDTVGIQGRF